MRIVIANPIGRLDTGEHLILFPSRWDWAGDSHVFSYYPYELAYLSSLLKRDLKGSEVVMVDGNHEQLSANYYVHRLKRYKADVLVTECSALTYPSMTKVVAELKKLGALGKAWLCGPYGMRNEALALEQGWDQVFHGEYERDVLWELQGWTRTQPTEAGLMHRTIANAMEPGWNLRKPYIDLNWLPLPEDADIRRIEYSECSNPYTGLVQVYPTRGCPLACTFCVVPMYYGGHGNSFSSHRVRTPASVCDEIEYLAAKYPGQFNGCFFNEETHNANVGWLKEFCETLIKRGLNRYHYDAMCGYWPFTEELIELMSRAGYCYIRMGIESLSRDVGKSIHKTIFPDKLVQVLTWCKKYGIGTYGTSQIGAPGSSAHADYLTLQGLLKLKNDGLLDKWQHSVSTPQPGTPMYEEAKAGGQLLHDDISRFNGVEAVMEWPDYPAEHINAMKKLYVQAAP